MRPAFLPTLSVRDFCRPQHVITLFARKPGNEPIQPRPDFAESTVPDGDSASCRDFKPPFRRSLRKPWCDIIDPRQIVDDVQYMRQCAPRRGPPIPDRVGVALAIESLARGRHPKARSAAVGAYPTTPMVVCWMARALTQQTAEGKLRRDMSCSCWDRGTVACWDLSMSHW